MWALTSMGSFACGGSGTSFPPTQTSRQGGEWCLLVSWYLLEADKWLGQQPGYTLAVLACVRERAARPCPIRQLNLFGAQRATVLEHLQGKESR